MNVLRLLAFVLLLLVAAGQFSDVLLAPLTLGPIPLLPYQTMMSAVQPGAMPHDDNKILGAVSFTFAVVDENGNSVTSDRVYLHHSLFLNFNQGNMVWPCGPEVFAGVGAELTPIMFPYPYVYVINTTDVWMQTLHIINFLNDSITVYIQFNVSYVIINDPTTLDGYKPLRMLYLDVDNFCAAGSYDLLGTGGINTNTHTYETHFAGEMVYAFGHMHAPHALNVSLVDTTNPSNPTYIFKALPTYSPDQRLIGMTHSIFSPPYPIAANTKLEVVSVYNDSQPDMGVMGIIIAYVHVFKFYDAQLPVAGGLPPTPPQNTTRDTTTESTPMSRRKVAELLGIGFAGGMATVAMAVAVYKIVRHVRAKRGEKVVYDKVEQEVFSL